MANIPIPENDDSLELNVRYQPDMVLEGMLDATVPEFTKLTLTKGGEVYDLTGGHRGGTVYFPITQTSETEFTTTATYTDVVSAITAGNIVAFINAGERGGSLAIVTDYQSLVSRCTVRAMAPDGNIMFTASTETDALTGTVQT